MDVLTNDEEEKSYKGYLDDEIYDLRGTPQSDFQTPSGKATPVNYNMRATPSSHAKSQRTVDSRQARDSLT